MKLIKPLLLLLLLSNVSVYADETKKDLTPNPYPEEKTVSSQHSVTIDGKTVNYTATAGNSFIFNDKGEKLGSIFYTAYTKKGSTPEKRPITFAYNGGPGSASVWLHLGTLGPRRVLMDKEGFPTKPPYKLVDNAYSILDLTDIVFIDPVGTGYSRVHDKGKDEDFHGVWEDIKSVSEFIRLYMTRNKRWASPKYLIGESYGTTRSAGIAYHMGQNHGVYFNGIMLVSNVLNFSLDDFGHQMSVLPPTTMLPSYTAAAWYHKQLNAELQADLDKAIEQAKDYALTDYALALLQGDWLDESKKNQVADRLSELTGLDKQLILQNNLRIELNDFLHHLLREQGKTVGRLDSRFVTEEIDAMNQSGYRDPSYMAIHGPYTATIMDYFARELNYQSDLKYHILGGGVKSWNYDEFVQENFDISKKLRHAMLRNPDMQIFVANGYYDFATPFFATEYTFSHMNLPKSLQDNINMTYYESGHMMYIREHDLIKLKNDIRNFFQRSL
ncbi:MAG: peptidase S10 [Kangiellaceae bacterium]|nr:peptidase S10 [Kangiellaceae bacterium]